MSGAFGSGASGASPPGSGTSGSHTPGAGASAGGTFGRGTGRGGASTRSCPCGSGAAYAVCCQPLHDGERTPLTAEELMRSRYAAFAVGAGDYLSRTWHPAHRPADLALDPDLTWTGLEVLDTRAGGPDDDQGEVEFRASWRQGRERGVLHERSRFGRRGGRWVYLDGDVLG
ncbi:YchJ family protein [Oryzihumus leptocrescens]|uniref:YchJ family protein n=1 Tax=Oryzihumus leptocrescens TaxID=297536 RepID=UPI00163B59B6|nr:YchJ family metal-binding protein [Oryzihumus leptocrescens]